MRALLTALPFLLFVAAATAQTARPAIRRELPPVSFTCPHHPDVIEPRRGTCPFCRMALAPVRLDSTWICPVHSTVTDTKSGACRLCRRQLVRVTTSITWTCRAQPSIEQVEPGMCPDGTPMVRRRTLRPHGNHNPQHGGQFFMAPDNWHHLEGAYPRDRIFRLYLYDDYSRPLPPDRLRKVRARVVTKETFDPRTRDTTEITAFPLRVARSGAYLEARIDRASLPIELAAKVRFDSSSPEYRFDFTFASTTTGPSVAVRVPESRGSRAAERRTSAVAAPAENERFAAPSHSENAPERQTAGNAVEAVDPTAQPIPDTAAAIVDQLSTRNDEIANLIARRDFALVWVPTFQAKELALALERHMERLPASEREIALTALHDLVRTAWLLDAYADVGNRRQIDVAYAAFGAALNTLSSAFRDAR